MTNMRFITKEMQKPTATLIYKIFQIMTAELVGTFFLAFFISSNKVSSVAAPYAIGLGLVALIYVFAAISGAQFNPSVTLALLASNNLTVFEASYCIVSQCMGVLLAGSISYALFSQIWNETAYPAVNDPNRRPQAFIAEMTQTFGLLWVVLQIAKSKELSCNSFYGVAAGLEVTAGALVIGSVSGACFNPAISILSMFHEDFDDLWVFILGPPCGGLCAAMLFNSLPYIKQRSKLFVKLISEFIGAFFLAWTVALSINSSGSNGYLAVGFITISTVYSCRHVSGGHFNPCVTLGVYFRGMFDTPKVLKVHHAICYMLAQTIGAFAAGSVAAYVNGGVDKIETACVNTNDSTKQSAMVIQIILSFIFVVTVLHTATNSAYNRFDDYFGLAIGFMISACAFSTGDIAGGVMNPAVVVALSILSGKGMENLWVYLIGDFTGALLAAAAYHLWWPTHCRSNDSENNTSEELEDCVVMNCVVTETVCASHHHHHHHNHNHPEVRMKENNSIEHNIRQRNDNSNDDEVTTAAATTASCARGGPSSSATSNILAFSHNYASDSACSRNNSCSRWNAVTTTQATPNAANLESTSSTALLSATENI